MVQGVRVMAVFGVPERQSHCDPCGPLSQSLDLR